MKEARLAPENASERICIDYTAYLAALCNKRWRFIDAIYGVWPIFGMVTKSPRQTGRREKLQALALQVLSTQASDETNIARLIALAQQQGLTAFDIQLPYALSGEQLRAIDHECRAWPLAMSQHGECLSVNFTAGDRPA